MGQHSYASLLIGLGAASDIQATQQCTGFPNALPTAQRTAAGSTIADATLVDKPVVDLTTVAASTGIKLSEVLRGRLVIVYNGGANTVNIFPHSSSATINGGQGGAAVTLATTKTRLFWAIGENAWRSVLVD